MSISRLNAIRLPALFIVAAIAACVLPQVASAQMSVVNEREEPLPNGTLITGVSHDFVLYTTWDKSHTIECATVTIKAELADNENDPILLRQSENSSAPTFEQCSWTNPYGSGKVEVTDGELWEDVSLSSDGTGHFTILASIYSPEDFERNYPCKLNMYMNASFSPSYWFSPASLDLDGNLDSGELCHPGQEVRDARSRI